MILYISAKLQGLLAYSMQLHMFYGHQEDQQFAPPIFIIANYDCHVIFYNVYCATELTINKILN